VTEERQISTSPRERPGAPPDPPAAPPDLGALDLEAHLADPARKQAFVTPMFDIIAPRYDRFTRVFSFGMDRGWKRELLALLGERAGGARLSLDIACGTGDLTFATARLLPGTVAVGVDASAPMVQLALRRAGAEGVRTAAFAVGDMMRLPFADASVDVVTAGYAFRNAPSYADAIAEMARVVRPGGVLLALDFYRPQWSVWRALFLWYLSVAGNLVGWLWHREPVVYGYIARSIAWFATWRDFSKTLEAHGFDVVEVRTKLGGGVAIHVAIRRHATS
jgi:ubiquinone/menaquinone biosynthesis methyltransferase